MTIVFNEQAKRQKPVKPKEYADLHHYLQAKCDNWAEYDAIANDLKKAEEAGTLINWFATNLDQAFTWLDSPQGVEYWYAIHHKLVTKP